MTESGLVRYATEDGVVTITLNRPDKMNALNAGLRTALRQSFETFEHDDAARVAIVTGNGAAFCAGADLKEMADSGLSIPHADFMPIPGRNITVTKPLIAAVNGYAYAGGFLLAQSCDLCIASSSASFAISEVKRGRGAPWAAPLAWMIPQRIAMELLLTGRPLDAKRAYEIGLVNAVTAPEGLLIEARSLAQEIAANAPLSVRAAKRMLYTSTEMGRTAALDVADVIYESVYRSSDAQEGAAAFRERRPPIWKDR
jgi:enoyl-CoA hydratase